jgi:hypothetical protein
MPASQLDILPPGKYLTLVPSAFNPLGYACTFTNVLLMHVIKRLGSLVLVLLLC